jgi:hypothetical protein
VHSRYGRRLAGAAIGGRREAVIRDVAGALQPYLDDHGLSFPIENHLIAAVPPSPTVDG